MNSETELARNALLLYPYILNQTISHGGAAEILGIRKSELETFRQLKIDRIDLLEKLFGQVLMPQAVFDELTVDERFKFEADQIRQRQFIIIKAIQNPQSANILKRTTGLDQGESEASILTDELSADG